MDYEQDGSHQLLKARRNSTMTNLHNELEDAIAQHQFLDQEIAKLKALLEQQQDQE